MIKQLATNVYYVGDLKKAKHWLKQVFDIEPYFEEPFYIGFNVGGYELGLLPGERPAGNNSVAYWRVDNIEQAFSHYLERGAQPGEPIENVGGDVKVATIVDPFGNHFGLIENPDFNPLT